MKELLTQNKKIWDLFTRNNEYTSSILDEHDRFLFKFEKDRNPSEPVVSEYLIKKGKKIEWPENYRFAVCLTHDIDNIKPSLKYRCFTSMKFAVKGLLNESLYRILNLENPYWNFSELIDLEKKYNAKSTFYFLAAEKDIHGTVYNIDNLLDIFKLIKDAGCEVGLHGGYYSYDNHKLMIKEKKKLEYASKLKISSYRNHYLRFKMPQTWENLTKAGFSCDTTFGYPDYIGFRNGLCHPFKPYNLKNNKTIDIWEIPLNIMDVTLFNYMNLSFDEAWITCKTLIDKVKNSNGVITLLWHNDSFDDIYKEGWGFLYEKILRYCQVKKGWLTSTKNILRWVNENDWWE